MAVVLKVRDQRPAGSHPGDPDAPDPIGSNLAIAVVLHVLLFGVILGWGVIHPHGERIGESIAQEGAIQASMVSAIPLPNLQRTKENQVLTSEKPSPAPVPPAKEETQPPPKPNDLLVKKPEIKPPKVAEKPAPAPPPHPQPVPPQPTKAATGETSGVQVAMATTHLTNGTASLYVEDRAFGQRFAYYGRQINQIIGQNWDMSQVNPNSAGKRAIATFTINRDGTLADIKIETRSGSPTLDTSVIRSLQRIEGFGPLPGGLDHLTVQYAFDYTP